VVQVVHLYAVVFQEALAVLELALELAEAAEALDFWLLEAMAKVFLVLQAVLAEQVVQAEAAEAAEVGAQLLALMAAMAAMAAFYFTGNREIN
jgi:hypothetical protein